MKQTYVLSIQPNPPDGPVLGMVMDPNDFQKAQSFAHDHITRIVKDLLVAGANAAQVTGFGATLEGGLKISIGAGNVVDANGVHYELDDAFDVTLDAADPAQARIDLIYATLEIDAQAESEFRPHRQLHTLAELEAGASPYDGVSSLNRPTEMHNRATINVHKGVPSGEPAAPAIGAGEVALWQVHVGAGEANLVNGDLTSVRDIMESLYSALGRIAALEAIITGSGGGLVELIQDTVGAFLQQGTGISLNYDDAGNVESISINTENVQDIVGALISAANASIIVTYNDAGNLETVALNPAYVTLLDGATAAATVSTLVKRDVNGDSRFNKTKVDAGVEFEADSSFKRSAFVREDFIDLVEVSVPVDFTGAVDSVYETVKRTAATTNNGFTAHPEFDCYVDPADYANVNFKFEVYAIHGGTDNWDTTIQLYDATDAAELAALNFTWLEATWQKRSAQFNIVGAGLKRLVLRAKTHVPGTGVAKIWRARLVINPSF